MKIFSPLIEDVKNSSFLHADEWRSSFVAMFAKVKDCVSKTYKDWKIWRAPKKLKIKKKKVMP